MEEILFTLIVFYILFRLFRRNVVVHVYKSQDNAGSRQTTYQQQEGSISVHKVHAEKKTKNQKEEEFVDFEEIK